MFSNNGFFGYAEEIDFKYFSIWHFLPIMILIAGILFVYFYREKLKTWKWELQFRYILSFVMLLVEMSYFWRLLYVGPGPTDTTLMAKLPLQVCEWTCILATFMVTSKSKNLFQICYFVCLTLGVVPLLTPAVIVNTGPSYYRYYQFWLEHMLPIFAVFYMMFVHQLRPQIKKIWLPYLFLAILAAFAIYANMYIPEGNYMYLTQNTDGLSFANIMPKNIWVRLIVYSLCVTVLFTFAYLPYIIKACKKKIE